jgi:hypothetical protein
MIRPRRSLHAKPLHEDLLAVFDDELQYFILLLHVSHLASDALWDHDGGSEHDRDVLTGHQIVLLMIHDASQMEHQELEDIAVHTRETHKAVLQSLNPSRVRSNLIGFENSVVNVIGDQGSGQLAEVLLQG